MTLPRVLCKDVSVFWRSIVIVTVPILLIPLLIINTSESRCAYVVGIMAVYWMSEVVPLAVTSFLPIFLFPLFNVMDVKKTCAEYLKDTNFLFVGGLMIALAVEECNLHKRIALKTLTLVGARPRWLMFGFMLVTAFLSMWISNTATTAMMAPIAEAVIDELFKQSNGDQIPPVSSRTTDRVADINQIEITAMENGTQNDGVQRPNSTESHHQPPEEVEPEHTSRPSMVDYSSLNKSQRGIAKGIMISICYAANIGGTGTLTGTGPNLVLRGQLDSYYENKDTGITYGSWMGFAIPPLICYLLSAWILLQLMFFGPKSFLSMCRRETAEEVASAKRVTQMITNNYRALQSMSFAEWSTLIWFFIVVALWIFRDPRIFPGWASLVNENRSYISDASPAMFVACVLFAWPKRVPDFICWRYDRSCTATKSPPLLTWSAVQRKFAWSVIMLLGGGFALAAGVKESNLSELIGCRLESWLRLWEPWAIASVFTIIITFVTEISSNTATASIFIPIMFSVAENLKINPLYFALPATIAPSFAFMLPVATPPNAIIYETGAVKITEMMFVGFFMNWAAIALTLVNVNTYAKFYYDLGTFPDWADHPNRTATC